MRIDSRDEKGWVGGVEGLQGRFLAFAYWLALIPDCTLLWYKSTLTCRSYRAAFCSLGVLLQIGALSGCYWGRTTQLQLFYCQPPINFGFRASCVLSVACIRRIW